MRSSHVGGTDTLGRGLVSADVEYRIGEERRHFFIEVMQERVCFAGWVVEKLGLRIAVRAKLEASLFKWHEAARVAWHYAAIAREHTRQYQIDWPCREKERRERA